MRQKTRKQLLIEERVLAEAYYIYVNQSTIRQCAKAFGTSKSTVHIDMKRRLPLCDAMLHHKVRSVLNYNWAMRGHRGGQALHEKVQMQKKLRRMTNEGTM